ncbi:MAG: phosphoribosyltransferase [Nitrososphaerales archaeon]
MKFIAPSWNKIYFQSLELAQKLIYDQEKFAVPKVDVIIGISRGGLVLTRTMSDLLGIDNVMIIRSEYYTDVGKVRSRPVISQKIQGDIKGKNVLLVDDVADSGESLLEIKKYLKTKHPKSLVIATLYLKPWSKLVPDYYVAKTSAWVIFPWEWYEAMKLLRKKGGMRLVARSKIPDVVLAKLKSYDALFH